MNGGATTRWRRSLLLTLLVGAIAVSGWIWWAERHPRDERALRVLVQDQLHVWFPDAMEVRHDGWYGLKHPPGAETRGGPIVLLVHGLDEPGDIWDDLIPALDAQSFEARVFRYPNDQGIDRSAAYLANAWSALPASRPVVLIGHSMGGLVVREFVTGWLHPPDRAPEATSPNVRGVILAGTPNHGSEWSRLRIWLELRDHLPLETQRRFSLFAALRDGTGAAKIDLRPESDFLRRLNARPWPPEIPIQLIGGVLVEPPASMIESLREIARELHSEALEQRLARWWSTLGEDLGDGVVSATSLRLTEAPPPILVNASHRGMLARFRPSDSQPPAIAPILETLHRWNASAPP